MKLATQALAVAMNAAVLSSTVGLCMPAQTAQAQIRGLGQPEITKRSLDQYARILGLDAPQREAMTHLQEAYSDLTRKASKDMEDAMKALREEADGDFSAMGEKMPKIFEEMGKKRAAAQEAFLADLRQLLSPAQESAWPSLERYRRREAHLNYGMVSGSSVDLTTVVDSMKLPEADSQKLHDTLEQYEQDMDRLLVEREKADDKKDAKSNFDMTNIDMEKIKAGMEEARNQSIKVRDLNRQYARRLASSLPDDARLKFEAEVKKRSFRQIYRDPHATALLTAASKFDDLDENQKKTIAEIKAKYEQDLTQLNDKWAAALEQAENEGKAGGMPFMGGPESDELKAARKARKDLEKATSDKLASALNDKQRQRLPKKPSGDRVARFGGDGEEVGGGAVFVSSFSSDDGDGEATTEMHVIVGPGGG